MQADSVILLEDGCIKAHDSPEEVLKTKPEFIDSEDDLHVTGDFVNGQHDQVSNASV